MKPPGWLAALVQWLQATKGVRFQIIFYLSAARCFHTVRRSWLASYESFCTRENSAKTSDVKDNNENILETSKRKHVVPSLHLAIKLYYKFSTTVMIYAVLKNFLPFHEWWDRYAGLGIPGSCIFGGHLIVVIQRNEIAASLFSCFHIFWRLSQNQYLRRMDLSLVQFLYQDTELVEAEQRRLQLSHRKGGWWAPRNDPPSADELYLRNLMCYKIKWNNHLVAKRIRSNRTLEAKRKLERLLGQIFLAGSSIFLGLASIFIPLILLCEFTDRSYLIRYPKCSPQLEQMMANGSVGWWSVTPTPHRFYGLFVDFLVNFFIWVDSGLALTLVVGLAYMLNFDLVHYWTEIHVRLTKLEQRLRCQKPFEDELRALEGALWLDGTGYRREEDRLTELKSSLERVEWAMEETNKETYEVQSEINDFFKQLRKADSFVSDLISATVVIWLASFLTVCYVYGTLQNKTEIRVIQFIGLVVITAENLVLLDLSIKVKQSYGLICTIMALDQSIHKEKFKIILDLYGRQTSGPYYTLAHVWTYRSSTFLSLVGWTFSLAALTETFIAWLR